MTSRSRDQAGSRTDPPLNVPPTELSDEQWSLIADLFPNRRRADKAAGRESTPGVVSMASFGFCAAAPAGRTCLARPVVSDLLAAVRRVDRRRSVGEGLAPTRAKA